MTKAKPPSKGGHPLKYSQKLEIIKKRRKDSTLSLDQLARWAQKEFQLPKIPSKSTMSRIFRDQYTYKKDKRSMFRKVSLNFERNRTKMRVK